jgi:formylmethanofuran dehydrogenase subunit C
VWSRSHADGDLVYINSYGGEADVTSYTHKGVVVVNGDAVVKGSFTGLIIATGRITVSGSGELYSSPDVVEGVLTAEQSYVPTSSEVGPRSDVFRFYPCATSLTAYGDSIDQLDYSDVIYYDNWRRY